ncbi:hypothetical protein PDJAM_G00194600 [Pangasius djambal]|uniref:Uncharacterized protein n=1 Tax=Pangasius djambal TaxID=1691987 RepID=A0ACC5ZQ63_9TELE|nr:hypothetical protein [Pangasius djambal]
MEPKVCAPLTINTHMRMLKIPFQIYSLFAVIMSSTLLGRLSTRCWSVAVGICVHSATRALVRSGADVGNGARGTAGKTAGSERVPVNDCRDAFMARHFDSAPLRV